MTSLDPKDYVWTNPLLNWQLPAAGLTPGHPLGAVPGLPGLVGAPGLPQPPFFPGEIGAGGSGLAVWVVSDMATRCDSCSDRCAVGCTTWGVVARLDVIECETGLWCLLHVSVDGGRVMCEGMCGNWELS